MVVALAGDALLGQSGFGWKQATVLVIGVALLMVAVALVPLPGGWLEGPRRTWPLVLGIGIAGAVTLWSRLGGLDQSLWHDEVFSVIYFVHAGPDTIVAGDYVPNNHVLFNLLNYGTTHVIGESEISLRLWAVLPALAGAALIAFWAWRSLGPWTALVAAVLIATSPIHHDLAREARGYGLLLLAGALMFVSACLVANGGGRRDWILLGLAGVVGGYTAPQFVLGFVGQSLALLVRADLRKRVLLLLVVVGIVLIALYAPVLTEIPGAADTVSGGPLAWHGFVSAPMEHLLQPSFDLLAGRPTDAYMVDPNTAAQILSGTLVAIGCILLWRTGRQMLCALLVAPILFVYAVLTLGRFHVHERYGSFLLFHALLLVAIAIVGLVRAWPHIGLRYAAGGAAVAVGAVLLVQMVDRSDRYQDTPRENFKRVAEVVRAQGVSKVVTDSARPDGLRYYLGADNVTALPPDWLEPGFCSPTPPVVFVEHPFRGAEEQPPPDLSCLQARHATMTRISQRDRGGHIDVWVLPSG